MKLTLGKIESDWVMQVSRLCHKLVSAQLLKDRQHESAATIREAWSTQLDRCGDCIPGLIELPCHCTWSLVMLLTA